MKYSSLTNQQLLYISATTKNPIEAEITAMYVSYRKKDLEHSSKTLQELIHYWKNRARIKADAVDLELVKYYGKIRRAEANEKS